MADVLFEIGAEEIPAGFVPAAIEQLERDLAKALEDARLLHGDVRSVGTPRRLAVWARDVAPRQTDARTEALGPPVAQAYDAEGKPTQAALGFARSQGVDVTALARTQTPKGERVSVTKVEKGRKAEQVLPALLEKLVLGIRFRKSMRSRWDDVTFARPVRWLLALYGGRPLRVRFGEVTSGKVTYGHRFKAPKAIALKGTPEDYVAKLRKAFVIVDPAERRALVEKEIARAAKAAGGKVLDNPGLVQEVTFLVETPTGIPGEFERQNLELPPEVVVSELRSHQRYFAVVDGSGNLRNRFVAVAGTPVKDPKVARHGFERVLRARLADARFFFEEDRKKKLADRVEALGRRTYQAKLGSELDRVQRIERIAAALNDEFRIGAPDEAVRQAARLCKADLGTGMVGEFPELQGIMGGHYARLEGLDPVVADAIEDHYKPIGASSEMPRNDVGALVAAADRLHQLAGIMGVGEKATSGADPFGLRRAAIGLIRILLERGWHVPLQRAIAIAADAIPDERRTVPRAAVEKQVREFVRGRVKALWAEDRDGDLVDAVLAAGDDDLVDARRRLDALAEIKARPDFLPLAVAFKRVANIQEKAGGSATASVDKALLRDEAEKRLLAEVERVESEAAVMREHRNYPAVLKNVATLEPAVARFFDDVLVMAEEPALRANRLGLMRRVASLFADLADFRKIQAELPQQPQASQQPQA
jgi:glycyl-tRNA synthetase beta chain